MSAITQCPECSTRFRVSQEQIEARFGMVRCGRCQAIFNAVEHLQSDEPSPQLELPIVLEEAPPIHQHEPEAVSATVASVHEETDLSYLASPDAVQPEAEAAEALTLAQAITVMHEADEADIPAQKKKRSALPWAMASVLLLLILLAQAAYFFRAELAARLPGLKPALTAYCAMLQCSVPLPQVAEQMSIESSDLEADPVESNIISLSATLRNRASYVQAYPNLELTLTDTQDKAVARRTFRPAEYLKAGDDEKLGLAANREISVILNLNTTDLKASGYRLLLFYPQ